MSTKQKMLLDTARVCLMLARELYEDGNCGKEYLLQAKWCVNEYCLLRDDVTLLMAA